MNSSEPNFSPLLGYGFLQKSSIIKSGNEWHAIYTCSQEEEIRHSATIGNGYALISDDAGTFSGNTLAEAVAQRFRTIRLPDDAVYEQWKRPLEKMTGIYWPEYTIWPKVYYNWVGHMWIVRITIPKVGWPLFQNRLKDENTNIAIYNEYRTYVHNPKACILSLGLHPAWMFEFLMPSVLVPGTIANWYENGYLPPWQRYPSSIQLYADHMVHRPNALKIWNLQTGIFMNIGIRHKLKK